MNKIAWVTGGTKGLGKELVLSFARKGYAVITNFSSDYESADIFRDEIAKTNYTIHIFKADVCNTVQLETIKQFIEKEYGYLDVLINNAGIGSIGKLQEIDDIVFSKIVNTNLVGKYNCIRISVALLQNAENPCIVNVASASGVRASAGMGAYCSSQAGVIRLTEVLAKELAELGIRINCVSPSMMDSGMSLELFSEQDRKIVCSLNPSKRLGSFAEISACIHWVCSKEASYINGANIMITGGN